MKYDDVPESVNELFFKLKKEHFPHIANAKILFLAHKKKMMHKGALVMGKIIKPNDLTRYLSRDEAPEEGYDFIILLDNKMLLNCEDKDIERVLRHELRHIFYDPDSKKPYSLIDHDFSDFHAEVELNKDDPGWAKRLSRAVSFMYHQEE